MKTIWKWVLGVVIVLVVVAAMGFIIRGFYVSHIVQFTDSNNFRSSLHDRFARDDKHGRGYGNGQFHDSKYGYGHRIAKHGIRGVRGSGFGGILHLILPLGALALVVYISYKHGMRLGAAEALISVKETTQKKSK